MRKPNLLQQRINEAAKSVKAGKGATRDALGLLNKVDSSIAASSLQGDFMAYHRAHPEVYHLIVRFAREVKAAGYNSYSMASIVERLRWHYNVEKKDTRFTVHNSYRSRYSRLIMETCPDLKGFFRTARLKTK